jgi:hypothetical protein
MNAMSGGASRWRRVVRGGTAVVVAVLYYLTGPAVFAQNASPENRYSAQISRLSPAEQAAKLSPFVGFTCIGTKPFLMGVTKEGPAKGYAYWSLQCAGGKSFMIQFSPEGAVEAIDCQTLKQNGQGRECYKAF